MPDVNDLHARLEQLKMDLHAALPAIAQEVTIAAKALIERNIREKGFGANYSTNKLPAWFFFGKAKSKAGEEFIKRVQALDDKNATVVDGKKVYAADSGLTWAQLRQAEGLPVDHVDLSFTNKTWAGLGPQQPYFEGVIIRCPLGGNTQEVVEKLNWNRDRYGDFFGKVLQAKEIEILTGLVKERGRDIFIKNGFKK